MDVYEELVRLRNLGQKCALATIVEVRGSIPSYESAKLLVREDGSMAGTIGGGGVEAEVWNAAPEGIDTGKAKHLSFHFRGRPHFEESFEGTKPRRLFDRRGRQPRHIRQPRALSGGRRSTRPGV